MSFEEKIKLRYPLPITQLYAAVELEIDSRLKTQKLIELFEGVTRYLALVGLAGYLRYQLVDPQVEILRPGLARPSLGHWVNLLKAVSVPISTHQLLLLGDTPNKNRNSDAIGAATRLLTELLDLPPKAKRLKLDHFLTAVVEFRNKKFGHGSLSKSQAKEVIQPLQESLQLWLSEITIFEQTQLVYLTRVEWQEPHFFYLGLNLNAGNYPTSFNALGDKGLASERIYLYQLFDQEFLSLHPFFVFDDDLRLLYFYNELSNQDKLVLRCPYETPGGETPRYLPVNKTIVVGLERPSDTSTALPLIETKLSVSPEPPRVPPSLNENQQTQTEIISPILTPDLLDEPSPSTPPIARSEASSPPLTFETVTEQLEQRIRRVCRMQARYPVLWVTGPPCSGKSTFARAVCQRASWHYIDFTLNPGSLDSLVGQEEIYQPEDFLTHLHDLCQTVPGEVIVLDEIEPLLGWWSWDEQDVFFRKIARATRLSCGVAIVTRLRNKQQLEKIAPDKKQVFEIPTGVDP